MANRRRISSVMKFIVGFLVLGVLSTILWWSMHGEESVTEFRVNELRSNFTTIELAQESYYRAHGKYGKTFTDIGFNPEMQIRVKFFLNAVDVPAQYRMLLREEDLPFVKDKDYQILAIFSGPGLKRSIWKLHKGRELEEILK